MTDGIRGARIAVLGDTHDGGGDPDAMLKELGPILEGAGAILHTGDVSSAAMLDRLETFAPVLAVRSSEDPELPPRLVDGPRSIEWDGLRIELHRVLSDEDLVERDGVDVVVHGGTHRPSVTTAGRTIYVNPGAPVFADTPSAGLLELARGRIRATLIFL